MLQTMDLIIWRHAEAKPAEFGQDDLARDLTPRGEKQAARMAVWLDSRLPEATKVLASPAKRTVHTAQALGRKFKLRSELLPDSTPQALLAAVQWPGGKGSVLVVGHQPALGQVVAQLLGFKAPDCAIKKGAVWWLRLRSEGDDVQTILVTVQTPELV